MLKHEQMERDMAQYGQRAKTMNRVNPYIQHEDPVLSSNFESEKRDLTDKKHKKPKSDFTMGISESHHLVDRMAQKQEVEENIKKQRQSIKSSVRGDVGEVHKHDEENVLGGNDNSQRTMSRSDFKKRATVVSKRLSNVGADGKKISGFGGG